MSKQTEVLKLALEALEAMQSYAAAERKGLRICDEAIAALREALADSALDRMAENARELGLDYEPAQQQVIEHASCQGMNCGITRTDQEHSMECQAEHAAAIAGGAFVKPAQQQEPVATVTSETGADISMSWWHEPALTVGTKLYTPPPASKPWVGLTDEEKSDLWCESTGRDCVNEDTHVFADAIEAKLREKNA